MAEVEREPTSRYGREFWILSRYATFLDVLLRAGVPPHQAAAAAVDMTAHAARETGWGDAEWWFNLGNAKSYSPNDRRYFLVDRGGDPAYYVAFRSLEQGVAWTVAKYASDRYRRSWSLAGEGLPWYDQLMRDGWHPWSETALREFPSIRERVLATVRRAAPRSSTLVGL